MKKLKYLVLALGGLLLTSCMGDSYYEPEDTAPAQDIEALNVVTIDALKSKPAYSAAITNNGYAEITEDIQIYATVTGNDRVGNLYNEISLQDKSGAILVRVGKGAIYGDLPCGQKILLNLKGLYIGGYGQQAQLGNLYEGSVGKIDRFTWPTLYNVIGKIDKNYREELLEVFDANKISDASYIAANAGKLMTIKNVSFKDPGKAFAPEDGSATVQGGCVNRALKGYDINKICVRTSTYADFANAAMPEGTFDITGIFTRFRDTWQIIVLSLDDIAEPSGEVVVLDPIAAGDGTEAKPFNPTQAIAKGATLADGESTAEEMYIAGWVSQIDEVSAQYGNATYYISVDGKTDNQLQVFRGKYLNGENFTSADQLKVGNLVVIKGKLKNYKGTLEVDANNSIISIK